MKTSDLVVSMDRIIPAPPETVYRALTERSLFGQWMGPEGSTTVVEEMELTMGGRLAFTVTLPDGGPSFRLVGFYEEIEPPRRLVHSWVMEGEEDVSTVAWNLEPHGDGTRLQLRHHGFTRPEDIDQNDAGWRHQLDRLETLLTAA